MAAGSDNKRIAQLFRMLGSSGGERRNAFALLEKTMQTEDITWTDIGDWVEQRGGSGGYSEAELEELTRAVRAEAVEDGIKIGLARGAARPAFKQVGGDGYVLPSAEHMARYCQAGSARLKDAKQRDFISDMVLLTRSGRALSLARLGYLVSIYIQAGGKIS